MGQHLFIELDQGQTAEKEGIWLFEGYIVQEEETSYVWTADAGNKLEKRIVELGEYDENMGQYEILSGLTEEDGEVPSDGEMPIEDEFSGEEDSSSEDEFSEEEDFSIDDESQGDNGGGKLAQ